MNQPFEMHIIESSIIPCQGLRFSIPSPFADNTTFEGFVEIHRISKNMIYVEMWGELPSIYKDMLKHRVKIASDEIPLPLMGKVTSGELVATMLKTIAESEFMRNGTRILFELHMKLSGMEI